MRYQKVFLATILLMGMALSACTAGTAPAGLPNTGGLLSGTSVPATEIAGTAEPTEQPRLVREGVDGLVSRLQNLGANVQLTGQVTQPFLPVAGQGVRVNGEDLQVFEFQDEAQRQTTQMLIEQNGTAVRNAMPAWVEAPTFWGVDRTLVLYLGQNQTTIRMLNTQLGDPIMTGAAGTEVPQPPQAVLDAERQIVAMLSAAQQQVQVQAVEQAVWPDACLGLPKSGENCAQIQTPGWRLVFLVNGQTFEFRTDRNGTDIRQK